jgi:hypothetical protein
LTGGPLNGTVVHMYRHDYPGSSAETTDEQLVRAFETLTLEPSRFGHAEHVRVAFAMLREHGLLDTLRRYSDGLRRFTARHGAADRYHETVTWGLVVLIHERLALAAPDIDWPSFALGNPDLLRFRDGAFFDYYGPEILTSELARRTFVLPR